MYVLFKSKVIITITLPLIQSLGLRKEKNKINIWRRTLFRKYI